MIRVLLIAILLLAGLPQGASAQDDDRGRLTRLIESQLSQGADRQVRIDGFRGALSSEATLDRMTISDPDGAWLILEDAALNWRRAALLRGELRIQSLTADRLTILRQPLPPEGPDLPPAAATPFSLPELPVSIDIGEISIATLELGEPILGTPAEVSLSGQARLAGGSGQANVVMQRLDGPEGTFRLEAAFDNATRVLDLGVLLNEAEGGIVAGVLNIPDEPSVRLELAGEGPLDDIAITLGLATGGEERVNGTLRSMAMADGEGQIIELDLAGDLSPLLASEYRPFFGTSSEITARVAREADGTTRLNDMRLASAALLLRGDVTLDPQSRPVAIDVSGRIADPDASGPIRLPVPGAETLVSSADVNFDFDATESDAFRFSARLNGLAVDALTLASAEISSSGRITPSADGVGAVTVDLTAGLSGIDHSDPDLSQALGGALTLSTQASWSEGSPIRLDAISVASDGLSAEGTLSAGFGDARVPLDYDLTARIADLGRFSGLAGQDLSGALTADLAGTAEALSGAFDLTFEGLARNAGASPALPPRLLAEETRLRVAAVRDETGTRIEDLSLVSGDLSVDGSVSIGSAEGGTPLGYDVALDIGDLGRFSGLGGQNLSGSLRAGLEGTADLGTGAVDFVLDGLAQDVVAAPALPPRLLSGETRLRVAAARDDAGNGRIETLSIDGTQFTLNGSGEVTARGGSLSAEARLADLGLFTTAINGPATVAVSLAKDGGEGWGVDGTLRGPGGLGAAVNGTVGLEGGRVDLAATGTVPLELANQYITPRSVAGALRFDLGLRGQPGLQALSGTLSTANARLSAPTLQFALENIGLRASLSGGQVSFEGGGDVSTGGRVGLSGSVNAAASGVPGTIEATLDAVRLVDPTLYQVVVSRGDLSISGALAAGPVVAGRIVLGESELRVPEAGLGVAAAVPDISHVGMTATERRTLAAAGFLETRGNGGGGSSPIGLDVEIAAPGRIFLRGRGIDAEFGGSIRIGGTTANVIPAGRFELVRGRISILGTRLDISEGSATLQGDFDPFLDLSAVSRAGGYRITIAVGGPASSPDISLRSDPFLPEDEILAQLLFGRSVSALSPIQLLQLADAASSLAGGRSDGGILSNLRQGLGLDNLDLQTDDEGNAAVRAGRYLSDNIYTDVTVGAQGDSEVSLNIDLTPSITARGSVSSGGGSSLGVFFERDY
ncbi:translocation/assembly module TamB domain-containing protein [Roseibacterium sp. SDUM158017]|uniref:translocation/assembly module TamB domain-containing protein n=1 Tax=Roseicyclus salinarum TaxID=3036773 RepID=UPI00241544D2|nr:translocation/assembly module TamB domain-containing protein [Roseibacterium sp. SDUM158017]MDG4646991.1 translocation/assembly module TamB domain-containing protein [Roseibacterium sp. SDUM158017]